MTAPEPAQLVSLRNVSKRLGAWLKRWIAVRIYDLVVEDVRSSTKRLSTVSGLVAYDLDVAFECFRVLRFCSWPRLLNMSVAVAVGVGAGGGEESS